MPTKQGEIACKSDTAKILKSWFSRSKLNSDPHYTRLPPAKKVSRVIKVSKVTNGVCQRLDQCPILPRVMVVKSIKGRTPFEDQNNSSVLNWIITCKNIQSFYSIVLDLITSPLLFLFSILSKYTQT